MTGLEGVAATRMLVVVQSNVYVTQSNRMVVVAVTRADPCVVIRGEVTQVGRRCVATGTAYYSYVSVL